MLGREGVSSTDLLGRWCVIFIDVAGHVEYYPHKAPVVDVLGSIPRAPGPHCSFCCLRLSIGRNYAYNTLRRSAHTAEKGYHNTKTLCAADCIAKNENCLGIKSGSASVLGEPGAASLRKRSKSMEKNRHKGQGANNREPVLPFQLRAVPSQLYGSDHSLSGIVERFAFASLA